MADMPYPSARNFRKPKMVSFGGKQISQVFGSVFFFGYGRAVVGFSGEART